MPWNVCFNLLCNRWQWQSTACSPLHLGTGFPYAFGRAQLRTQHDPQQNLVKRITLLLVIQNKGPGSTQILSCSFLLTLKIHSCGNSATLPIPMLNTSWEERGWSLLLWWWGKSFAPLSSYTALSWYLVSSCKYIFSPFPVSPECRNSLGYCKLGISAS